MCVQARGGREKVQVGTPVIGWRRNRSGQFSGRPYIKGTTYKASCGHRDQHSSGAPNLRHTCGFYGYHSKPWYWQEGGLQALLWGTVIRGRTGRGAIVYRAQYMRYID